MKPVKLIFFIILTVLCAVIIFMFSAQDGNASNSNSLEILRAICSFFARIFHFHIEDAKIIGLHYFFRKTAHFTVYMILSILSYNVFRLIIIKKKYSVFVTMSFCVLMAVSDEFHQVFTPGRTAQVKDIFIDTLGICVGLGIILCFNLIKYKFKKWNCSQRNNSV